MGRPARFTNEQLLAATARVVIRDGLPGASVAAIAREAGAPVGSVYHRFPSRDVMLARAWLDAVATFQAGFLAVLGRDGAPVEVAVAAARFSVSWAREQPERAQLLMSFRRRDLLGSSCGLSSEGGSRPPWPADVRSQARSLAAQLDDGLAGFAARFPRKSLQAVVFAVVDVPVAALRRHLIEGVAPPQGLDDLVASTVRAALGRHP